MKNLLLISASDSIKKDFQSACEGKQGLSTFFAGSSIEAGEILKNRCFELTVIDSSVCAGEKELISSLCGSTSGAVILVLNDAQSAREEIYRSAQDLGVIAVSPKHLKGALIASLHLIDSVENRVALLQSENDRLKHKMYEIKIVNRAKLVLMSYLSMSEKTAHRYIEKQAMDMRTSRVEVAEQILKTYEN